MKMRPCCKKLSLLAVLTAATCPLTGIMPPAQAQMGGMAGKDMKSDNAAMLIKTLSEEKTEINALSAQQAAFKQMGDKESLAIAAMYGRWIREHKAAGPKLMMLIKANGGDPMMAKIEKAPVLGEKMKMLHAVHVDHEAAVMSSQQRFLMTSDPAIKMAMHKRANLARKHLKQMTRYHNPKNCPMCMQMMKDMKPEGKSAPMDNSSGTDMGAGMNKGAG